MSDELLHQIPVPAPSTAEAPQPSEPATVEVATEGTGASETVAETEEQAAERRLEERKVRQDRARRNQESAFRRLAAERDELQKVVMEMARKNMAPPQGQTQPAGDGAPRREDFASWEAYEDARIDWRAERKAQEATARREQEMQTRMYQSQREQYLAQVDQAHQSRVAEFAQRIPDYAEVTDRDDIIVPNDAADAIKNVPNGPEVIYAIGKEPALAQRLHTMTPNQQAAFVGQLSAALLMRQPQVSKAPAPGKPVGGRGSPQIEPTTASAYYDMITKSRRGKP